MEWFALVPSAISAALFGRCVAIIDIKTSLKTLAVLGFVLNLSLYVVEPAGSLAPFLSAACCLMLAAFIVVEAARVGFNRSAALLWLWLFATVAVAATGQPWVVEIAFVAALVLSCPLLFLRDRSAATP